MEVSVLTAREAMATCFVHTSVPQYIPHRCCTEFSSL